MSQLRPRFVVTYSALACWLIVAVASGGRSEDAPGPSDADSRVVWSGLMSAEMLDAEVKVLRSGMNARLTSLGAYNSSYLELRIDATTLALLAHVATQHDEAIRWKSGASSIRMLAGQIAKTTASRSARGRKTFVETRESFQTICQLLDGEDVSLPVPADVKVDFSESVELEFLMKRNDRAMRWLKASLLDADDLKENSERAQREFGLLALTGVVITQEDYGYTGDDEFAGYAEKLSGQAKAAAAAAGKNDFDEFQRQSTAIGKSCIQCHSEYR